MILSAISCIVFERKVRKRIAEKLEKEYGEKHAKTQNEDKERLMDHQRQQAHIHRGIHEADGIQDYEPIYD